MLAHIIVEDANHQRYSSHIYHITNLGQLTEIAEEAAERFKKLMQKPNNSTEQKEQQ